MMEAREVSAWAGAGIDRRLGERKKFRAPALLRLPDRQVIEVRTFDISVGGIGVVTPMNLRQDVVCDIRVRPPILSEGMEVLLARGRIAHSILSGKEKGFLIGLEFVEIASSMREIIKQYVSIRHLSS
ncbi:PilZ domain-containing protein [uncultured Azohydromonas sp.]|jgi:Predicted glycosyltransferase|uniref:PilZ domain-containing protein n=1 Tax=uncultured Azohydromonas sp. TaxID=487342 RepID=UPI00262AD131|nr:PilZ domain-containing protein [uncultured Azohydromonas sp.]